MKLFISYSHDDQGWVAQLSFALRNEVFHDVWYDERIIPASDWWKTILDTIEASDCFIYVMTPKAVESIYCQAELRYALALNKPILPLRLKTCDVPEELAGRRAQYLDVSNVKPDRLLLRIVEGLWQIQLDMRDGHYKPKTALRPDEPKPQAKNTEHIYEVFALAEEAAAQENYSLAEQLFERVRKADPKGLGVAAEERLSEIRFERDRKIAYEHIVRMVNTSKKGAKAAWGAFIRQYGAEPDPENLAKMFKDELPPPPDESDSLVGASGRSPLLTDPAELTRLTLEILPQPFEWCLVKGGEVVLEDASSGGGTKGGRYEVPDFLIAKYPITNAQYEIFVVAKDGYAQADWWDYSEHAMKWRKENSQPQKTGFAGDDLPRTNVSWYKAVAFCRWLDAQIYPPQSPRTRGDDRGVITLPTEQQWQRAAIGDTGWVYPWGNTFDTKRCNSLKRGIGKPTPVTQYPKGASPYGVFDMSGNVWEWCLTEWGTDSVDIVSNMVRVLRGGSFGGIDLYLRAAGRYGANPNSTLNVRGFRCVRY